MTTFTRILLNPQRRDGRKLLTNPQAMHAAVRSCFPSDQDDSAARILWRVDRNDHDHVLYIVGPEEIDPTVVVEQAGWPSRPGQTADYRPLLNSLRTGHERAFRLTANPVRALPTDGAARGRIVPHVTPEQQVRWLVEKASRHGFEIRSHAGDDGSVTPDLLVDRRADLSFARRDPNASRPGRVTLRTARFEGTLRITDADLFRETLVRGLGRGKAYGCGLITLARIAG